MTNLINTHELSCTVCTQRLHCPLLLFFSFGKHKASLIRALHNSNSLLQHSIPKAAEFTRKQNSTQLGDERLYHSKYIGRGIGNPKTGTF